MRIRMPEISKVVWDARGVRARDASYANSRSFISVIRPAPVAPLCERGLGQFPSGPFVRDRIVGYVEYNSVSAGLAATPRAWPWSSARSAVESACPTIGANSCQM